MYGFKGSRLDRDVFFFVSNYLFRRVDIGRLFWGELKGGGIGK